MSRSRGAPGSVLYGDGLPSDAQGKDGDFFLQVSGHKDTPLMHGPKAHGTWAAAKSVSLRGPSDLPRWRRWWLRLHAEWTVPRYSVWDLFALAVIGWALWQTNH